MKGGTGVEMQEGQNCNCKDRGVSVCCMYASSINLQQQPVLNRQ